MKKPAAVRAGLCGPGCQDSAISASASHTQIGRSGKLLSMLFESVSSSQPSLASRHCFACALAATMSSFRTVDRFIFVLHKSPQMRAGLCGLALLPACLLPCVTVRCSVRVLQGVGGIWYAAPAKSTRRNALCWVPCRQGIAGISPVAGAPACATGLRFADDYQRPCRPACCAHLSARLGLPAFVSWSWPLTSHHAGELRPLPIQGLPTGKQCLQVDLQGCLKVM